MPTWMDEVISSYADPNFRTVLSRGIQWAAGRL